jgi:hypothetical protein
MSPRLITIIVLKSPPNSGNTGYPIYAFAGMYVEGCNDDPTSDADVDRECANAAKGNGLGHLVVWGRMVNLFFAGDQAGPPNSSTTVFSISLVQ